MRNRSLPRAAVAVALFLAACGVFHRGSHAPPVLDLNSASRKRIETLPGITPSIAGRIVDGRPYESPSDLVSRGILTERELERIEDQVTVKKPSR